MRSFWDVAGTVIMSTNGTSKSNISGDGAGGGVVKSKTALLKCPSPPRPGQESQEITFKQKLEEIKRQRLASQNPHSSGKLKKKVLINGKAALDMHGDWALMESSSGKKYFFNVKTMVNQWNRPKEWPQQQPQPKKRPPPPPSPPRGLPPPPPDDAGKKFQMKMKDSKLSGSSAIGDEEGVKVKLPKPTSQDESPPSHRKSKRRRSRSRSSSSSRSSRSYSSDSYYSGRRSASPEKQTNPLVLAAKAKIESQMTETDKSINRATTLLDTAHNPTWISEYNFPAMLMRCKFPKKYDAVHELQTNRSKKRILPTPIPIDVSCPKAAQEIRKNMFTVELKNPNNRYRLLCEKLGVTVYKIPDELWERSYGQFQVELNPRVKLEARPNGYTEDDKPVYTRTGKVANRTPYPEDVVRCHAVMQAWGTDLCHCVYANKIYTIEKDDKQWIKDLDECKRFLQEEGF